MGVLTRELAALYNAFSRGEPSPLTPLPLQYGDFARWQRGWLTAEVLEAQLAYWREQLHGASPALELATDRPRPAGSTRGGARLPFAPAPELACGLAAAGRREGATPFMLLLAGFQAVLSRWSGSEDICVGSPVANRRFSALEGIIGFLANTIVLRTDLAGDPDVRGLLRRVRATALGAYAHQDLPFERLVQELAPDRDPGRQPLFQVMLAPLDEAVTSDLLGSLTLEALPTSGGAAKFDLTLHANMAPERGLAGLLEYRPELFDRSTVQRLLAHLETLLGDMLAMPERRLADLSMLSAAERRQLLAEWNDGPMAPDSFSTPGSLLHELFAAQARASPGVPAVVCAGERLSYGGLDRRADQLARALRARGVGWGSRVGLCLERSAEMVVGILAVLKTGAAYVPLDPDSPMARLAFQLEDAGVTALLTQERLLARLPRQGVETLCLELLAREPVRGTPPATDPGRSGDGTLAYIIYTSGSTGRPKGVAVTHANVRRLFEATAAHCQITPRDVWTLFHSYAFDFSVWEIWGALLYGGTLVVVPYETSRSAEAFYELLARERVTVLSQTPSAFRQLIWAEQDRRDRGADLEELALRLVIFGGEALEPASLALWFSCHGDRRPRLVNMYGITETTVHVTWRPVGEPDLAGGSVIGRAIPGWRVVLLERGFQPVPIGVPGEIFVGGSGLALGYLGRPELTAERFVPDPFATEAGEPGGRLYRTGDLARRRVDGDLEFLGRTDQQVKVRGFRIELGEIEAVLSAHPAVRHAVVVAHGGGVNKRLVAYVLPATGERDLGDRLRAHLRESQPDYMVPASFVPVDSLPLTASGKVDRQTLAMSALELQEATGGGGGPRTPTEEVLAGIWAELLGLTRVGVRDGFFDLGGHSLLATRVISRLRSIFGVELPLRTLFERPSLAELAAAVEEARRGGTGRAAPPLVPVPRDRDLPLSFAQERLWFLDQLEPGSAAYNVPLAIRLRGGLQVSALAAALDAVVERHEALRTTFALAQNGPVQQVAPHGAWPLALVDLAGVPGPRRAAELRRLAAVEELRPFDLARGPLVRGVLARLDEETHAALLTLYHIVCDGWSLGLLVREVAALYTAFVTARPAPLAPLPVQYADFALWQRSWLCGDALDSELAFWREALAGVAGVLDLPADRPRPAVPSGRGATRTARLSPVLASTLTAFGRGEGSTPFMILLAAWNAVLFRLSEQADLVVGTPIANRNRLETEGLIGFFTNTLALRTRLAAGESFLDLARAVREQALRAYAHQDLPFERLVEELAPERSLAHTPLFQVLFAFQNLTFSELALPGLTLSPLELGRRTAKFDLSLFLAEAGDGLTATLEFAADLFDAATAERFLERFQTLLAGAIAWPRQSLAELPLLPMAERHQVLCEWNDAPAGEGSLDVHVLVEAQARRTPGAAAVLAAGGAEISYGELDRLADGLARRLQELGVRPDDRVGVCLERGWEGVVALLAVLKVGGCYLPLDPAYPGERLGFMLADAAAPVIVTRDRLAMDLPPHGARVLSLDGGWPEPDGGGEFPAVGPDHLSYVIYTSGSTGRPKGVALPHRTLANLIAWQVAASAAPAGRTLQFASASFDVSLQEILATWAAGGTLVLLSEAERGDPEAVLRRLCEARVERLFLPFVALQQLAEAVAAEERLPPLREVVTAGEQLQVTPEVRALFSRLPGCVLRNQYGPSETHVVTEASLPNGRPGEVAGWPALPPIGRPIAATDVLLLDPRGAPVPIGVPGEVYLAGAGLARGYLGRPDLTVERFVPDSRGRGGRLYRTGDLARYRPSGEIEFLGRIDHQVKIRGFRVELGEIEAALATHPAVREAVVVSRDEGAGKRLVAYVLPAAGAQEPGDLLRAHLRTCLPDYMVPAAFVPVAGFPLTASGKVDRQALAASGPAPRPAASGAAPRTPTEQLLAEIWSDVLGLARVGAEDDFFALGGHSLLATRVVSRLRKVFGVELPLRKLFEAPTVAALSREIEAARALRLGTAAPPILPVPPGKDSPLSFAQERLWFLDRLEPDTPTYNVPIALALDGALDVAVLAASLCEVVRRHAALRTTFAEVGGRPVQRVAPRLALAFPLIDLGGLPAALRGAEAHRLAEAEALRPFDLGRGPLLRASLVRSGEGEHMVLLTLHHIVSDGWSMGVLTRELGALYRAFLAGSPSPLPELPVQYPDFAASQRALLSGERLEAELAYWRRALAGLAPLDLPTDRPRPAVQTARDATHSLQLSPEVSETLARISREQGATQYMTLLAALAVLLGRYASQDDVAVGSPIANRNRAEIEGLIGFFVNTLVLRADCSPQRTFRDLLAGVRTTVLDAFAHQDLPFEKLVEELQPERVLGRTPLFQVMFALQNADVEALELPGLTLRPVAVEGAGAGKFDLTFSFRETPVGLAGAWGYNRDLFERATMVRMAGRFAALLAALAETAALADRLVEVPLAELPLLSEVEHHQVLLDWSGVAAQPGPGLCLHELFAEQAARHPEAVAVACGEENLSYGELDRRTVRLARRLRGLGVGPEAEVGLMAEPSIGRVLAVLAVLRTGGAYVPLDPEHPPTRLSWIVESSDMKVLLADEGLQARLSAVAGSQPVLSLAETWRAPAGRGAALPVVSPSNVAYVIYTSGSTGRPNGVLVPHRGPAELVTAVRERFGVGPGSRVPQACAFSFDASVLEIFLALGNGAMLVVARPEERLGAGLAKLLGERGITTLATTSPLLETVSPEGLALAAISVGGDRVSAALARRWSSRTALYNCYGPTETTVFAVYGLCREEEPGEPPIGRPLAGMEVYLVDRGLAPVSPGSVGELLLGGAGLARGYAGQADKTAERFVPHPYSSAAGQRLYRTGDLARYRSDGRLEFLGRIDTQVKIRGVRIEPGEIEAALAAHPAVCEAVVLAVGGESRAVETLASDKRLVAFVVAEPGSALTSAELRELLRRRLPESMIPSEFILLDALPLTPNGKVDRRALAGLAGSARGPEAESRAAALRTPTEQLLAGIWSDVLGLARVGAEDDFFALGGHSLLATRVVSQLRKVFGVELPLRKLFEAPTVAALSREIEAARALRLGTAAPPLLPVPLEGMEGDSPLSFAQERLWFLDQLKPGSAAYNLPAALALSGPLDVRAFRAAYGEILRRHEVLRTTFTAIDGRPVQRISPPAAAPVPVVDLAGLADGPRQAAAERLAAEEVRRAFDLSRGPLVRLTLLRLGGDEHLAVLVMHHVVADGWSMEILTRELTALYAALLTKTPALLPELPVQYADYAVWQRGWLRGEALEQQLAWWRQQLAGSPTSLDLPFDRPRPAVADDRGAHAPFRLSAERTAALQALSRHRGATLFMTLLAGWSALLARATAQEDLLVGSPIANRTRLEVEGLIGFFVNTLVLRTDLSGEPGFGALIERVRHTTLGAYDHQEVPFERLVEELAPERSLSHSPLFQVVLALQSAPAATLQMAGLTLRALELESGTSKFDLALSLHPGAAGLQGSLEYSAALFDRATAQRLLGHFDTLLGAALADPARPWTALPVLAAAERSQILVEWNDTARSCPQEPMVHELFAQHARRDPQALAMADAGGRRLTYGELEVRSNRLAWHLRSLGVGPDVLVAVCTGRTLLRPVGILGVVKAGGAYVTLDPAYPPERLAFLLDDSRAPILLTEERFAAALPETGARVLRLDADWERIAGDEAAAPESGVAPDNLAYVVYTSGSTGRPKGVEIPHAGLMNLVRWHQALYGVEPGDHGTQIASPAFDASIWELWPYLTAGAVLFISDEETRLSSPGMIRWWAEQGITLAYLMTPLAEGVLEERIPPGLDLRVRALIIGGDRLHAGPHPEVGFRLMNHYGPAEYSVTCTVVEVPPRGRETGLPTIGRAIDNTRIYLLDRGGRPVPVGVPGELYVAGVGLARGYHKRPELTAEKFVPDPFAAEPGARMYRTGDLVRWLPDGDIDFLGRLDHQVKIRGHRVELSEIEAALIRHPGVAQGAVLARDDLDDAQPPAGSPRGERRLVAYVVPAPGAEPAEGETSRLAPELRAFLRASLPEPMVPALFVFLDRMPLTPGGKLDRRALPRPDGTRPDLERQYAAPRDRAEQAVADVWARLLGVERVGIDDNFFELGGHSLLATRVIAALREAFGVEPPLRTLFEKPTVAELALVVAELQLAQSGADDVDRMLADLEDLSDDEVEALLAAQADGMEDGR